MFLKNCLIVILLLILIPLNTFATESDDEDGSEILSTEPAVEHKPEASLPVLEEIAKQRKEQTELFELLGVKVKPGNQASLSWFVTLSSINFNIPVIVVHGKYQGPVIGITAALHGDELNGIEIVRQVLKGIDPEKLAGTIVAVPIVNLEGFLKQSRYIADRRDLNRYFPGNPQGVMPSRYADGLFQKVILKCDSLVDLHTGSYYRTNLPQLRADLSDDMVATMVERFGSITVLNSAGSPGMLRNAATSAGVPAVTLEVGGPLTLNLDDVFFGVHAVNQFLGALGMIEAPDRLAKEQPIFYESKWVMAEFDGIFLSEIKLGAKVKHGEQIARIVNPMTNAENSITAPFTGTVLGMAENQFVSPGYLIFRIGVKETEAEAREKAKEEALKSKVQKTEDSSSM